MKSAGKRKRSDFLIFEAAFNRFYVNVMRLAQEVYQNESEFISKRMRGEYATCFEKFIRWCEANHMSEVTLAQSRQLVFFDYAAMLISPDGALARLDKMIRDYAPNNDTAKVKSQYYMGCLAAKYLEIVLPESFIAKKLEDGFEPAYWMSQEKAEEKASSYIEIFNEIALGVATPHVDDAWGLACRKGIIRPSYIHLTYLKEKEPYTLTSMLNSAEEDRYKQLYVSRIGSIERLLYIWGGFIREYNEDKPDEMKLEYPAKEELASCLVQECYIEANGYDEAFDPEAFLKVRYKQYKTNSFINYRGLLEGTRKPR